jgi:diketogulonate reductase-like aldo/keto reductase
MKIPTKKLKNGFEIPEYGLGTWQMGGRRERDLSNDDRDMVYI